jgi:ABC-type branched-subunit amino acid transport system substrate-binding protein
MFRKLALTILAATALAWGATASAADQKPLKIGALMPMTGALQAYGATSVKGAKLAAKEINDAGGVLGQPIKILVADAQTRPQAGVDAANKLANVDGAVAFVGALSSGVTIPIALSVSKPDKILQISPASTSPALTTLDDDGYLFRTTLSDAFQGVAMAQVAKKHDVQKTAVIYVNNDYGEGLAKSFTKAFEKLGGEVTHTTAYEPKQASYRSSLKKLYGDGSTPYLVLVGYVSDGETILRQSLEGGMFTQFIFSDGMKSPDIVKHIGAKYLNNSFGTVAQVRADSAAAEHFQKAYKEEYGKNVPQPYIDTSYDAVYLIALAAQKAGTTTDGSAIRDALTDVSNPPGQEILPGDWSKAAQTLKDDKKVNWTGAAGEENFDKHGDVAGTFAEWKYKNGKVTTLRVFNPAKEMQKAND